MATFRTPLEASSYLHPSQDGPYASLRKEILQKISERGFEYDTVTEYPLAWAEDQDPFNHVTAMTYPHMMARCFNRLMESFKGELRDKYEEFMAATGVSAMTNRYTVIMRKPLKYPDLILVALRITEVRFDRMHIVYSIWSTQRLQMTAEVHAWIVFCDHRVGKAVSLVQLGGMYKNLYSALVKRAAISNADFEAWQGKEPRVTKDDNVRISNVI